ncbi:hypothetical protein H696_05647 [Fonticula alba]|uniref:Uncharacterized protein n=1 Tax=Fonticula alba TaxID=691883 RepID=A0A058Z0Z0_FONAL|nr:hypothetical protein H696_05647 [Fonticula alba]KCV67920.1 hypothetical protein H696_05647 [Fonticula alba]|eukprot:XP_009497740.1 hypothetical protein H696_05647 [Fonticula alba]
MSVSIITLQTCSRLAGDEPLKASLIVDALGVAPLQHVLGAAAAVRQDRRMDALVAFSQGYLREGRSTLALLEGISRAVAQSMPVGLAGAAPLADAASTYGVHYAGMSNFERAALAKRLAQAEKRLAAGASEFLQLMDVLSYWLQFVQLQST